MKRGRLINGEEVLVLRTDGARVRIMGTGENDGEIRTVSTAEFAPAAVSTAAHCLSCALTCPEVKTCFD